jgi:hypothetical protein
VNTVKKPSDSTKFWETFEQAKRLAATQEGLSSMELVSWLQNIFQQLKAIKNYETALLQLKVSTYYSKR